MKKKHLYFSILILLFSCGNEETNNNDSAQDGNEQTVVPEFDPKAPYELYRSNEESFQPDFLLKYEKGQVTLYGWEITLEEDTIYYQCFSRMEGNFSDSIRIKLDDYEQSFIKTTADNLDHFQVDTSLHHSPMINFHSSFFGKRTSEKKLTLQAVKHIYMSRADIFYFERIK